MSVLLPLQPGTLAPGVCFASEQERLLAFAEALRAILSGQTYFNYGSSTPAPENNAYPWFRTTDGIWYTYSGAWISPVGPEYHVSVRRLWVGSLASLPTYDGGDAGAASDRSGPMWVEDTDFIGRSPMHPGAIPAANPAKTLTVGENFGDPSHVNVIGEMVEHQHAMKFDTSQSGGGYPAILGNGANNTLTFNTEKAGATSPSPFNLVHPVRGCYIIKWSGRAYRRA